MWIGQLRREHVTILLYNSRDTIDLLVFRSTQTPTLEAKVLRAEPNRDRR